MGGRIIVESVAGCSWNGWPDARGIRIFQYIVYSAYLEQNKKIQAAQPSAPEVVDFEHPDPNPHAEMKPLKRTRAVIVGVILLTPLLMGA
ncbi:hypothetical protein PHLH4_32930 [Pseudomonas sp. St316]|nr:hypothetical protein PHLH4_32930 [Pseudomonas sp. St316]